METISYINCIYRAKEYLFNSPFDNQMTIMRMCNTAIRPGGESK